MLLAEVPKSRALRPVLAARIATAHVQLSAAKAVSRAARSRRSRKHGRDAFCKEPREPVDQQIEWVCRVAGHEPSFDRVGYGVQPTPMYRRFRFRCRVQPENARFVLAIRQAL